MGYHSSYYAEIEVRPPLTPEHGEQFERACDLWPTPGAKDVFADPLIPEAWALRGALEADSGNDELRFVGADKDGNLRADYGEGHYAEDFYRGLKLAIEHFFTPLGYKLIGDVNWTGEQDDDRGTIYIHPETQEIEMVYDHIENAGPSWDRKPPRFDLRKSDDLTYHLVKQPEGDHAATLHLTHINYAAAVEEAFGPVLKPEVAA